MLCLRQLPKSKEKTIKQQNNKSSTSCLGESTLVHILVANGETGILRKISCFQYIKGVRVDQVFGIIWQNKCEYTSGRAALSHEVQSYVWNNLLHFAKLPLPRVGEAVTEHTYGNTAPKMIVGPAQGGMDKGRSSARADSREALA